MKIFALSAFSGLALTASFPGVGWSWAAWFALAPLLLGARDLSAGDGFRAGFVSGLVHYITLTYWLFYTMGTYGRLPWFVSIPVLLLFASYLALYPALFLAALNKLRPTPGTGLFLAPALWVSLEYIRARLFTGFPWELIGGSQYKALHIIQISDIFGVYGVSFLVVMCNWMVLLIILHLTRQPREGVVVSWRVMAGAITALILALGLTLFYGRQRIREIDSLVSTSPAPTIAVVQGNIDQLMKWDPAFQISTVETYARLSLEAKKSGPDLVVWPETATPFYFGHNAPRSEALSGMVRKAIRETGADFLFGSPSFTIRGEAHQYHNSAFLLDQGGVIIGKYDKSHLVPFGEYTPFKRWLPFIGKIVEHVGDFTPGEPGGVIQWGPYKLGVQICYETIFPELSRLSAQKGAEVLITLTNDAWYGDSSAPPQLFSMAVFRAVETRRALVRAANTGISGFIDPAGRIRFSTPLFQEAAVAWETPFLEELSLYTRFGDVFAWICLAVCALRGAAVIRAARKSRAL
ncbi:MAG: apolipoprotein N-acyltransferase [Desulfobacterales bacterium]|nr:apolipoprotein N-acyltransferase [Desulfobacterales bacterium]